MESIWDSVIEGLDGGDVLSDAHGKKIHKAFPVSSDFRIKWAIAENFGRHLSGIADKKESSTGKFRALHTRIKRMK